MFIEKREYPRFGINFAVKLSEGDYDIVTETKNISGNGAYCSVNKEVPLMTKLKIVMFVPLKKNNRKILKKIVCRGVVVRKEEISSVGKYRHNIAIYFNEIAESDRKIILSYFNPSLKAVAQ